MAMNEPTEYTWLTAQITEADKAALRQLAELDSHENGTVGNMSATLRRLIRQEAQRRLAPADAQAVAA